MRRAIPNQEHLKLQNYELDRDHRRIVFSGRSIQPMNACSLCRQPTHRVHSHYTRRLADLSWADYAIVLQLEVRKFFCDNAACQRRIFTERLPTVMAPWARRTQRLAKQLYEMALRLGGAAGAKMSQHLFGGVSRNTLLRLLMKHPLPTDATPITLGVDDFALRKRQTYGTILVDLDRHRPIALLPGRDAAGLSQWLMQHPGIQVLSRDRSPVYKSGMSQGAPAAIQVADRFHLIHNLAEVLEQVFRSQMSELRRITSATIEQDDSEKDKATGSEVKPINAAEPLATLLNNLSMPLKTHYQRRRAIHHVVWQLFEQGWSTAAVAQYVGMNIRTVQRDLNKPKHADPQRRVAYGKHLVSPYRVYILQRCTPGRRCIGLFKELQAQGYKGSERTLSRYLTRLWKGGADQETAPSALPPLPRVALPPPEPWQPSLSANRATWLVLHRTEPQTAKEKQLHAVLKSSAQFAPAIDLAQAFARLIRQRQPD